jgi:hypothetical protein
LATSQSRHLGASFSQLNLVPGSGLDGSPALKNPAFLEDPHHASNTSRLPSSLLPDMIHLKFSKLYERLSFIEDSLSRVELQQDSLRPLLKTLESTAKQVPVAQFNLNVGKKQQKENTSTPANMALLERLTSNA